MRSSSLPSLWLVLSLLLLAPWPAHANSLFPHPVLLDARNAALADVDGDGHLDRIHGVSPNRVQILRGAGDGTFASGPSYEVGESPGQLLIGDFNGDGHVDIATGNTTTLDVSILLNKGDGTFFDQQRMATGFYPFRWVSGNFNGDAFDDVAVLHSNSQLAVLTSNGDGTFEQVSGLPQLGTTGYSLAAADFDEDGTDDLITTYHDRPIWFPTGVDLAEVLLCQGDGTFQRGAQEWANGRPEYVSVAHLDDDGLLDAIVSNRTSPTSVTLMFGKWRFGYEFDLQTFRISGNLSFTDAGDFNGDGLTDVVFGTGKGPHVILATGDRTFQSPTQMMHGGGGPWGAADVNGDGKDDLLLYNQMVLANPDGTFGPTYLDTSNEPAHLTTGDPDGNGTRDLMVASWGAHVDIFTGYGDGTFAPADSFGIPQGPNIFYGPDLVSGFFDSDAIEEIALGNYFDEYISVVLGLGNGTYGPITPVSAEARFRALNKADLNKDGKQDLVAVEIGSHLVWVLLGRGDGSFEPERTMRAGDWPLWLDIADLNQDGHLDIVTANSGTADLSIFFGVGDGSFGPEQRILPLSAPGNPERVLVKAADLDADGLMDLLLTSNVNGTTVAWGTGGGNFSDEIRLGFSGWGIDAGDLNGDGLLDVAYTRFSHVLVRFNSGDREFAPDRGYFGGRLLYQIAIDDYNGDGKPDLATSDLYGHGVAVLLNQGVTNQPPVAAGQDVTTDCTSAQGALVTLDGSASSDPDSSPGTSDDIKLFEWFEDPDSGPDVFLGNGETLPVQMPLGVHRVILRVTDNAEAQDEATILVEVRDMDPPELTVGVAPGTLWPPNHRMVAVDAMVTAEDACGEASIWLVSVASDEPDDTEGGGDGNTADDIQAVNEGTADVAFELRAERQGGGSGRRYTVVYQAVDAAGNMAVSSADVHVPHDVGGSTEPLTIEASGGSNTVIGWNAVPGALSYDVVRGELEAIKDLNGVFHLGSLHCIAAQTAAASTVGQEDGGPPALGQGFFYLAAYDDGLWSGYGTVSAAKERFVPPGQDGCH